MNNKWYSYSKYAWLVGTFFLINVESHRFIALN